MSPLRRVVFLVTFLGVVAVLFTAGSFGAGVDDTRGIAFARPLFIIDNNAKPVVSAPRYILVDLLSGQVLAGERVNDPAPIASVSKIMTALVAERTLDLHATTTVSEHAVDTEGRAGRLKRGEKIGVRELLFPLLLESSNDAAEALAESSGNRNGFVYEMNTRARALGLLNTGFDDPSGLSPQNHSTPADLAHLLGYLFEKDRYILDITLLHQYVGESHDWLNNDPVVGIQSYEGGKHGFTPEAGRTFTGVFNENLKNGGTRTVGIVVLGSKNIRADVMALEEFAHTHVTYTSTPE